MIIIVSWDDGTGDKIVIDYSGTAGETQLKIETSENGSPNPRTKKISLKTSDGKVSATITVTQNGRKRAFSKDYSKKFK